LLVVVGACTEEPIEIRTVNLEPYRRPCEGVFVTSCMTGTYDDGEPTTFYEGIEGFEFQWGATRRVTYATYEIHYDEPVADAPSVRYELQDETLVDVADTADEFTLLFDRPSESWFRPTGAADRRLFGEDEIACDPALCAELDTPSGAFTLRLKYEAPAGAVATALAIE